MPQHTQQPHKSHHTKHNKWVENSYNCRCEENKMCNYCKTTLPVEYIGVNGLETYKNYYEYLEKHKNH